jgi:hypothetical protein
MLYQNVERYIKVSAHNVFSNNIHQVRSKSKSWKVKLHSSGTFKIEKLESQITFIRYVQSPKVGKSNNIKRFGSR